MNRTDRVAQLLSLAKKENKVSKRFSGKKNRKDIQKYLEKVQMTYRGVSDKLHLTLRQSEALAKIIEQLQTAVESAQEDMEKCYDMLKVMDLTGVKEVVISEDSNDIFYVKDGKKHTYSGGKLEPKARKKDMNLEDTVVDAAGIEGDLQSNDGNYADAPCPDEGYELMQDDKLV